MYGIKERYTELGMDLYNACYDLYQYLKDLIKLNKNLEKIKPIMNKNEMDSASKIFRKAEDIYRENIMFRLHIVMCILKAIIVKTSLGVKNLKMEAKLVDFYRYLCTLNKQSSAFVVANLGLHTRGISD